MEFDIGNANNLSILTNILREWGPQDLSIAQENFLNDLANAMESCSKAGTVLHINF